MTHHCRTASRQRCHPLRRGGRHVVDDRD
jgi:hypothetical protein